MAPFSQWILSSLSFASLQRPIGLGSSPAQEALQTSKTTTHGAIACESAICSNIGASILKKGGNAVDATIATVLCVGVVGFYHSGIGGGGFAIVRSKSGEYEAIDFRESAPGAASEDMYRDNYRGAVIGGLAAGVPGELRGLEYLHTKYGKTAWRDLVIHDGDAELWQCVLLYR